jgi:hypothetical protein
MQNIFSIVYFRVIRTVNSRYYDIQGIKIIYRYNRTIVVNVEQYCQWPMGDNTSKHIVTTYQVITEKYSFQYNYSSTILLQAEN